MKIKKLPISVIQQIAAGEVVERPSSVMKELVENSLDAGAKDIRIRYEEGGIGLLQISDDGCGVSGGELDLVFESHATSKLESLDDLDELLTMGFRGEAMSSIAAVAKVNFRTSTKNAELGNEMSWEHGKFLGLNPCEPKPGTQVLVQDLFGRLPVRRKFLKSPESETRALYQCFRRYALAHADKRWEIAHIDGSRAKSFAPESRLERFLSILEEDRKDCFFETQSKGSSYSIDYIGLRPRYFSSTRKFFQIFLNNRPVQDRQLEFAVRRSFEGYAERLGDNCAVMYLEVPAKEFDVNIHPTKSEVRFHHPEKIFSFIVHSLRSELEKIHRESFINLKNLEAACEETRPSLNFGSNSEQRVELVSFDLTRSQSDASEAFYSKGGKGSAVATQMENALQALLFSSPSRSWEYLGVVDRTYLLAKRNEELFIFDQHALHERILYENLTKELSQKQSLQRQRLLFPIKLQWDRADILHEHQSALEELGFEIREWSDSKYQIVAVPSVLKRDQAEVLSHILDSSIELKESMLREAVATIACHSAVRAHDVLEVAEAQRLLTDFETEDALGHCPHGRPTFVRLDQRELKKFFHRPV
ncbi:MAG: hypothetical protein COV44_06845 [Deltaproteobacteria bacterium CG11_big_fil_rev_8_21_14_0_20_45_16]|nr:MAG: hypothetical protein COV44_06845 [Deltaproteobacteria bacterium CG11_big_fil_rev_8_21_14_0_20_45_16]